VLPLAFNWLVVHSERGRCAFREEERRTEGRAAFGVEEILRTAWNVNFWTGGVTRDMLIICDV
jgi:hypothetical protein